MLRIYHSVDLFMPNLSRKRWGWELNPRKPFLAKQLSRLPPFSGQCRVCALPTTRRPQHASVAEVCVAIECLHRVSKHQLRSVSGEHGLSVQQAAIASCMLIYLGLLLPAWPGSYTKPPPQAEHHCLSLGPVKTLNTQQAFGSP